MASPSALTLPAAASARHFPISRRGRRVPRRQHPTGPLGGQGRSAVRGRPVGGPFWARLNRSPRRARADNFDCNGRSFLSSRRGHSLRVCERFVRLLTCGCSFVDFFGCGHLLFLWWLRASGSKGRVGCLCLPAVSLRCAHSVKCPVKCLVSIWFAVDGLFCPRLPRLPTLLVSSN